MADEKWQQIRTIFDDALRRRPEVRAQFVTEICGKDVALLDEVKSLLSSFESAESFLEMPAIAQVADVIKSETKKLEKGTRLARYEIIRQIGAGGMGEVYLARDEKLDRQVAVKILNEQFSRHESNLERFIREAKAASALNHPNILIVHEVGESDKTHYIVSEFIEGKTLRERLNETSPPSLAKVLDIAVQTANALSAAHEANLIHRDIKPENIMIRPDGFVKVLDFGLAKLIEQKNKSFLNSEESTGKKNETAEGVILGTINYMSPEQTRGKDVDARTDVWSLGVVLYEMLTGKSRLRAKRQATRLARFCEKIPRRLLRVCPAFRKNWSVLSTKLLKKTARNAITMSKIC